MLRNASKVRSGEAAPPQATAKPVDDVGPICLSTFQQRKLFDFSRFFSIRQKSGLFILCRRFAEVFLIGNTAKGDFRTDIATLDLRLGAE